MPKPTLLLVGVEHLRALTDPRIRSAKMVFNTRGAIILPSSSQHRDSKAEGISYEDNYRGNALAALLTPGSIEVRFHNGYSDAQVIAMLRSLLALPLLDLMADWRATYQGRPLTLDKPAP